jgi:hypothetical protein
MLLERTERTNIITKRIGSQQFRFDAIALSKSIPNSLAPLPSSLPNIRIHGPMHNGVRDVIKSLDRNNDG